MKRMLTGGLIAGFAAGLFAAALHFAFLQEIILHAELYETGELVHFGQAESHDQATVALPAETAPETGAEGEAAHDHASHDHGDEAAPSTFERNAFTVLFDGLLYAGFGLILAAAFQIASMFGLRITLGQGLLWGIAGFVSVQLAPAMGLAPELPGNAAADITARQIWWLGTVLATGAGLGLIGLGRRALPIAVGALLIALPHVIGAPMLDAFHGFAPPELAGEFSARVLGVGLATWAVLGLLTARLAAPETVGQG